jgi:anti-sigma factor ChrR (cupin superfamily)
MRRAVAVLAVLVLAGCGGLKDIFRAHVDAVAVVGDRELSAQRMADLFAQSRALPLQPDVMARVAHLWASYLLFADRILAGDSLLDSASVLAANWHTVQQILIGRYHDQMAGRQVSLDSAQVDSIYAAGELRLIRHILVRTDTSMTTAQRDAKRRQAERLRTQLASGTSWDRANQASDDPSAKAQDGSIGVIARGETVGPFEAAAFALAPGEMAPVTETPFGFHVLRRPRLSEVRAEFQAGVRQRMVAQLDSAYLARMPQQKHLEVRSGATAAVREVAQNPIETRQSHHVLATFDGGRLTSGDIARWLDVLPPRAAQQLQGARDEDIKGFVTAVARNQILLNEARAAGLRLDSAEYGQLRAGLRQQLGAVRTALGLDSLAPADTASKDARHAKAVRAVDANMGKIIVDPKDLMLVPAALVDLMGQREPWRVNPAGVERAMNLAQQRRSTLDSAAGRTAPGEGRSPR